MYIFLRISLLRHSSIVWIKNVLFWSQLVSVLKSYFFSSVVLKMEWSDCSNSLKYSTPSIVNRTNFEEQLHSFVTSYLFRTAPWINSLEFPWKFYGFGMETYGNGQQQKLDRRKSVSMELRFIENWITCTLHSAFVEPGIWMCSHSQMIRFISIECKIWLLFIACISQKDTKAIDRWFNKCFCIEFSQTLMMFKIILIQSIELNNLFCDRFEAYQNRFVRFFLLSILVDWVWAAELLRLHVFHIYVRSMFYAQNVTQSHYNIYV